MTTDWLTRPTTAVVDLGPAGVDLRGYRGDSFTARFTFRYVDGTPVALDGTWLAQLRLEPSDADPLDSFAVDTTDQATGVVVVSLTPAQTVALAQRTVWDLQNVATAGTRTWFAGTLYLGGEVTR